MDRTRLKRAVLPVDDNTGIGNGIPVFIGGGSVFGSPRSLRSPAEIGQSPLT